MRILNRTTTATLLLCLSLSPLVTIAACSDGAGGSDRDETPGVGQFDPSTIDETLPGAQRVTAFSFEQATAGYGYRVRFRSLGRDFSLRLTPNYELFAPDATVERDGVLMTMKEAGLEPPLRGMVEGDPKSWVRLRLQDGAIDGLIFTQSTLYEVRPSGDDPRERSMARASLGDYLEHPTGKEATCGVVDSSPPIDDPETQPLVTHHACIWIGIHIIADYTHVAKLGGAMQSEADMSARMNEIDAIYRGDLEYGFRIEKVTSHPTQGGPGYNVPGLSINAQLTALTSWKQQNDPMRGVVHLFAGRVTSGAVGLAYVGSLCTPGNASGVSNYLGANRGSTIDACHEIGHNFGANHDSGNGFIMQASVNSKAEHFSAESMSAMRAHVGKASTQKCFSPCGVDPGTGGAGGSGGTGGSGGAGGSAGRGGSGGSAGTGGTGGSAGRGGAAGSMGAGGSAGVGVGGSAGAVGVGGSGGAGGNSGGSSGSAGSSTGSATGGASGADPGAGGKAGASVGVGGGPGAGAGGTGIIGRAPRAAVSEPEGCSCRTVGRTHSSNSGFAAFLTALAATTTRLRRNPKRRKSDPSADF